MTLKYVSSKSKFVDVDSERPRLLNMETAYNLLLQHGVENPQVVLAAIMLDPIPETPKEPAYRQFLKLFNIFYKKNSWYIQGVAYNLEGAVERLQDKNISKSDALRALAFAVDVYDHNR